jgi:predicted ATPase
VEVQVAPDETSLHALRDPRAYFVLDHLRRYLSGYAVYHEVSLSALREPYDSFSKTSPDTALRPDGANLVGVVARLKMDISLGDASAQFREWVRQAYPECDDVGVRDVGSGSLLALQWREYGREPLHAGQLSDGVLRFLCLAALCASPEPPPLVAIDEPEIGLHPGLLPLVAAMLETLSERTQVLVITHSPRLLSGFSDIGCIRVISKDEDGAHAHRPGDSKALQEMLKPTVGATLGELFESGELEVPRDPMGDAEGES